MDLKKQLDNDRDAFIEKNKKFIYDTTYNICKKDCSGKMMTN